MNILRTVDLRSAESQPGELLNRLQKFLPEIAAANADLDNARKCDIEITTAGSESDDEGTSSSSSSSSINSSEESEVSDSAVKAALAFCVVMSKKLL